MSEPRPAERVYVTINEIRHELVPIEKFSFPETKLAKTVCGMPLAEMETALKKLDSDAFLAWIFVSLRRVHPKLTVEELLTSIGDTPVLTIFESLENVAPEVASEDPPAAQPLSEPSALSNGDDSSVKTPPHLTLETAGQPI